MVFEHVTGRKPDAVNPRTWNFATDLAINSHLHNLPENCVKPGQGPFAEFPEGLSAEAYLELLKKKQEEELRKKQEEELKKKQDQELKKKEELVHTVCH